jgi:nitrogen fixation protein FixH
MAALDMIIAITGGVLVELLLYLLLRRVGRMTALNAAGLVALAVLLIYIPYAMLAWPGGDVFAIHLAIYLIFAYILYIVGSREGEGRRRWHWAPALIIAFFAFVVGMNVVFLGVAEQGISGIFAELLPEPKSGEVVDSRFPGTVSHDFQKKEALYNAYLQQVEEQRQRGWQVQKGWQAQPVAGEPALLRVAVLDAEDRPVTGADITGRFLRTSNSDYDFDFRMTEIAPGDYQLESVLPLPGLWRLVLTIRRGDEVHEIRAITSVLDPDKAGP